jgi:hypothetical protein
MRTTPPRPASGRWRPPLDSRRGWRATLRIILVSDVLPRCGSGFEVNVEQRRADRRLTLLSRRIESVAERFSVRHGTYRFRRSSRASHSAVRGGGTRWPFSDRRHAQPSAHRPDLGSPRCKNFASRDLQGSGRALRVPTGIAEPALLAGAMISGSIAATGGFVWSRNV